MAIKTSQHFFLCIFFVSHSLEEIKNLWETIVCSSTALAVPPNLEEYGIYFSIPLTMFPLLWTCLVTVAKDLQWPRIYLHLMQSLICTQQSPRPLSMKRDSLLASGPHIVQIFILLNGSFANVSAYPLSGGILCVCVFSCWTVSYVTCV